MKKSTLFSKSLFSLLLLSGIFSAQIISAQDSENDGVIDVLENALTQGDLDPLQNSLDLDSDDDGISDTIEYGVDVSGVNFTLDADADGIPDAMDASGGGTDANGNGVLDSFDPIDTDGDGIADLIDLDSDNDGIYDVVEAGYGANDTNNDGRVSATPTTDVNANGQVDAFEGATPPNTITSTPANFINTDSDGDGCSDADEAYFGSVANADSDDDGKYGAAPISVDPMNGKVIGAAYNSTNSFYLNGNANACTDTDNDGVPDSTDLDDDNDGILDTVECGGAEPGFSFLPNGDFGVAATGETFFNGSGNGAGNPDNYNTFTKPMPAGITTTYGYQPPRPTDGNYAVVTNSVGFSYVASQPIPNFWLDIEDFTIDATGELGYFALFNASGGTGTFFEQTVSGLAIGEKYKFSSGIINLFKPGYLDNGVEQFLGNNPIPPNVTMVISDTGGNTIAQFDSGNIPNDGTWKEVSLVFTATASDMVLSIQNNTPGGIGNDFGIDNVALEIVCDFDGDGIPNNLDLDSDNDGISDVIESGGTDTNRDGRADDDDNNANNTGSNGIPSSAGTGTAPPNSDGNANDLANYLDIDTDDDGIPDNVEGQPTATYQAPSGIGTGITDANMNGVDDNYENGAIVGINPENTDLMDEPDYLDNDSDNDTILDIVENGDTDNALSNIDTDHDGLDDAFDDNDDSAIAGVTVNDGINPPNAGNLGDVDNDLGSGGDVDYRDVLNIDSDGDGITDTIDLDDDNDGIPDTVEGNGDSDGDGIPDYIDLDSDNDGTPDIIEAGGTDANGDGQIDYPTPGDPMSMIDTNNDGLDDGVAASPLPDTDSDGDGLVDRLDLDSDNDGIADIVEAGGIDANGDGQVDYATPGNPATMLDVDRDGFIDTIDTDNNTTVGVGDGGTALPNVDTDLDGFPNRLDLDSDNDGIHDVIESGGTDADGDGRADDDDNNANNTGSNGIPTSAGGGNTPTDTGSDASPDYLNLDSDGDGCSDANEAYANATADGGDGGQFGTGTPAATGVFGLVTSATYTTGIVTTVTDATNATACTAIDFDGDGIADNVDLDDDNDGIPDTVEGTGDSDNDGIPDYLDLDSDNDGIPDSIEAGGTDADGDGQIDYPTPGDPMSMNDTNNDGLDDGVAASPLPDTDSDGDGLVDRLDLDSDNDGIADIIEAGGTDANGDGQVDYATPGNPTTMLDVDRDGFIDTIDTNNNTITGVGDGGTALPDVDTDGPGRPNRVDLDSDNDGIYDVVESGGTDADGDGRADDDDNNVNNTGSNGIPTSAGGGNTPTDTGADGSTDYTNLDSDGDGCSDANEAYGNANVDGGDNGVFGFGIPTTDAIGLITMATYDTGVVAAVTDATDATACDVLDSDGDGVLDNQEITDGTDFNDPCDFVIASITQPKGGAWLSADCDGDGVTNEQEIADVTDPENPCDFNAANITLVLSGDYLIADCDGDGVTNGTEITDGTDPENPCEFLEASVTLDRSGNWLTADCDGDMISNGQENTDGTNPNDPCSSLGGNPPPEAVCDIVIETDLMNPRLNNGIFRITNIEAYPENEVKIYNRWGILVFGTEGYDNSSRAFRGISNGRATIQMNKELPVGIYFYVINYRSTGTSRTKSGYLYVNR